jgi:hypothetical protein
VAFSVEEIIDRHVERLHEEREPDGYWHPSSMSNCLRQAVYEFRGTEATNPRDARSRRVLRVGHMFHEFVQTAIASDPAVTAFFPEIKVRSERFRITGSGDGLRALARLKEDGEEVWELLELKSINSMAFRFKDLPKANHVVQVSIYMKILREEGGQIVNEQGEILGTIPPLGEGLKRARLVYLSKDDLRVEEHTVLWTPAKDDEIIDRLAQLEEHQVRGSLPRRLPNERDKKTGQERRAWLCGFCPFEDRCWKGDEE